MDSTKHNQAESIMDSAKHYQAESIVDSAKHYQAESIVDSAKRYQAESIVDSAKHYQAESIVDSAKRYQVGVFRKHPPISPLSLWERARVRGSSPDTPHHQPAPRLLDETLRKIRRRHR
jgi:type III secretion system FlhB-like substrate exporter